MHQTAVADLPLPSFLLHPEGRAFPGRGVLHEFETPLAELLWHSLRVATMWTAAEPAARPALFLPSAAGFHAAELERHAPGIDAAALPALRILSRVPAGDPALAPGEVAEACVSLADWAEGAERYAAALEFLQVALLALPDRAPLAHRAGRLARRLAEYARARAWFERAIRLSRHSHDRDSYTRSLVGLGNLCLQRGNLPAARRFHERALRVAERYGIGDVEGMAAHDLFVVADASARWEEADTYAERALRCYGGAHPRLPSLAHDVAASWMSRGEFARALPVLQALLVSVDARNERLLTLGNIARAAGATGDAGAFAAAAAQVQALTEEMAEEGAAQALLDVAHGALSLRDRESAQRAAAQSLRLATLREQAQVRFAAEAVLDSVSRTRQPAASPAPSVARPDPLASRFAESLYHRAVAI